MKSYEEALSDVYARAEAEKARRRDRANRLKKAVLPAVCICLVAVVSIGTLIWRAGRTKVPFEIPTGYASAWKGLNAVIVRWGEKCDESFAFADDEEDSGYREVGISVQTVFSDTMSGEDADVIEKLIKSASSIVMPDGSLPEEGQTSLVFLDKLCGVRNVFEETEAPETADLRAIETTGFFIDPPAVDIVDGKISLDGEAFESRYGGEDYMPVMDYLSCANEYIKSTDAGVGLFEDGMSVESLQGYFEYLALAPEDEEGETTTEITEPQEGSVLEICVWIDDVVSIKYGFKFEILIDGEKVGAFNVCRGYYGKTIVEDGEHTVAVRLENFRKWPEYPETVQQVTVSGNTFVSFGMSYERISNKGHTEINSKINNLVIRNGDGSGLIEVPDCNGLTVAAAKALLEEAGFVNIFSDTPGIAITDTAHIVVSMIPSPGSMVNPVKWIRLTSSPVTEIVGEKVRVFVGKSAGEIESALPLEEVAGRRLSADMLYWVCTDQSTHTTEAYFNEYLKNAPAEEKENWICEKITFDGYDEKTKVYVSFRYSDRLEENLPKEDAITALELALTNQRCPDAFSGGEYDQAKLRNSQYDGIYRIRYENSAVIMPLSENKWRIVNARFKSTNYPKASGSRGAIWCGDSYHYMMDGDAFYFIISECIVECDGDVIVLSVSTREMPQLYTSMPVPVSDSIPASFPKGLINGACGLSEQGEIEKAETAKLLEQIDFLNENYNAFDLISFDVYALDYLRLNVLLNTEADVYYEETYKVYCPNHPLADSEGGVTAKKLRSEWGFVLLSEELSENIANLTHGAVVRVEGELFRVVGVESGFSKNLYIGPDGEHIAYYGKWEDRDYPGEAPNLYTAPWDAKELFSHRLIADYVTIEEDTVTAGFTLWEPSDDWPGYDNEKKIGSFDLIIKKVGWDWKISGGSLVEFLLG